MNFLPPFSPPPPPPPPPLLLVFFFFFEFKFIQIETSSKTKKKVSTFATVPVQAAASVLDATPALLLFQPLHPFQLTALASLVPLAVSCYQNLCTLE